MARKTVLLESTELASALFGAYDANVRKAEQTFGVQIINREGALVIDGEDDAVERAAQAFEYLKKTALHSGAVEEQTVDYAMSMTNDDKAEELATLDDDTVCITAKGKPIKAKTVGQKRYVDLIDKNTVIVGVGPAGTGKTFLAVAQAVTALRRKQAERIILTRPAIEAGENLGYLPGDLQSKIDPYLRPLYDALFEMMGPENYQRNVEKQIIEVAPLAYMRGRTLDDAFIILDEAQNATFEQMKMFLTRLGNNSKAIVTGDLTQTDLPGGQVSGLWSAVKILDGIEGIAIHQFTDRDVVRHKLVQKIILAYDKYEKENQNQNKGGHTYRRKNF